VLGSALAMDKIRSKQICRQLGIRTADWIPVQSVEQALEAGDALGYPVIVKPVSEGSSLGVTKSMHNGVADAFELARQYGDVMMERFIDGMEVTAAVLDGQALPLVSMATPNLFYDYDAKYFSEHTQYKCPVDLPDEQQQRIRETALMAFDAIGARDWGRVDFMVDRQGNEYFMELNTAPGMTDHSLVPMAAAAVDVGFPELCQKILRLCVHRSRSGGQVNDLTLDVGDSTAAFMREELAFFVPARFPGRVASTIGLLGLLLLVGAILYLGKRGVDPRTFPVNEVEVSGTLDYTNRDHLRERVIEHARVGLQQRAGMMIH